jgi:hypothetical protein
MMQGLLGYPNDSLPDFNKDDEHFRMVTSAEYLGGNRQHCLQEAAEAPETYEETIGCCFPDCKGTTK